MNKPALSQPSSIPASPLDAPCAGSNRTALAMSRIVTFASENGTWRSRSIQFAGFVPMRGDGAHTAYLFPLTPDGEVQIQTDEPADAAALGRVLDQPATEAWTGVTIPRCVRCHRRTLALGLGGLRT